MFGICLILLAAALNVGWILLNLREAALLVFGVIFFAVIITGLVLNTIFLIREIRRNEQHDAFLNSITHELKTPIASIKLYLETLKTRNVPPEKQNEFYDVMLADTDRLLGTVEQVLQASRTREKKRQINISEIDLRSMINESIDIIRTSRNLDAAAIRFTEPADAVKVLGDAAELQSVFINLLDNAVKYSDSEVKIEVDVTTLDRGRAVVRVKDAGIGIPRGQLKRIFKRFHRVPMPVMKRIKGTGLGLFIVRSIVEKHGGRVFAESEGEGEGSTFTILLPRSGAR